MSFRKRSFVQEAFIRGCDRIDQFAGSSSLGTWLHRIVVNTALMHLRRRGRDAVILPDSEPDQPEFVIEGLIDRESEPGGEVLSRELVERIEHAVLALPDSLRAAFVLRDLEGLSTREAATALGISESALKVRLHRAHLALRAGLAPYLREAPAAGETEEVDR
jgi:RNA polymerase sigma-70 factor, ECF subfamily